MGALVGTLGSLDYSVASPRVLERLYGVILDRFLPQRFTVVLDSSWPSIVDIEGTTGFVKCMPCGVRQSLEYLAPVPRVLADSILECCLIYFSTFF